MLKLTSCLGFITAKCLFLANAVIMNFDCAGGSVRVDCMHDIVFSSVSIHLKFVTGDAMHVLEIPNVNIFDK